MVMPSVEKAKSQRPHVFAVNSSLDVLAMLREFFQEEQYRVTITHFDVTTFDQIAAAGPSLLVIDLAVGEQAGWDLLERLRTEASTTAIPVIMLSTSPQLLEQAQADPSRFGGQRFLQKPFDLNELLEMANDLTGLASDV
jgi:DNA-binding response OmpR family regulator